MKNLISSFTILSLLAAVSVGCMSTGSTTVRGRVVYDGKPVEGAEVSFGPTLGEATTRTGPDGKFELTARHRPTAMLYLKAAKPGMGQREKVEFPGFAAPDSEIEIEMIGIIVPSRK